MEPSSPLRRQSSRDPETPLPSPSNLLKASLFPHQVGGHSPCAMVSPDRVAKGLSREELHFYNTIPSISPEILPFIPQFFGLSMSSVR
jgi:hypothetical protein